MTAPAAKGFKGRVMRNPVLLNGSDACPPVAASLPPPWTQEIEIGGGQYGRVFRARVNADSPVVAKHGLKAPHFAAVKVIDVRSLEVKKKSETECKLLQNAGLSPNVVKFFMSSLQQSRHKHELHILLELMNLGSLYTVVSHGSVKAALAQPGTRVVFAKAVGVQVLLGLLVLHEYMVVIHRDVKFRNILLNADGRVKLCDFDCGFDGATGETFLGTECTMAPEIMKRAFQDALSLHRKPEEQANPSAARNGACSTVPVGAPACAAANEHQAAASGGQAMVRFGTDDVGMEARLSSETLMPELPPDSPVGYKNKCDIWSTGAVLYELVTGSLPYSFGDARDHVMQGRQVQDAINFMAVADADVRDLLQHMLCDDPHARWSAAQCLAHASFDALFAATALPFGSFDGKFTDHMKAKGIAVEDGPAANMQQLRVLEQSKEYSQETKIGVKGAVRKVLMCRQLRAVEALKNILATAEVKNLEALEPSCVAPS